MDFKTDEGGLKFVSVSGYADVSIIKGLHFLLGFYEL